MGICNQAQTEPSLTENCNGIQSVGEESVDSQLIARHGRQDRLCVFLSQHHSSNSTIQPGRTRGGETRRERQKLIPQCDAKGKGYLGWQMRNSFNYLPAGSCGALAERSTERNILGSDRVPIGHGIMGNWTRKAGLIEWEEEWQRAVTVWLPVGWQWGRTGLASCLTSCIVGYLYLSYFVFQFNGMGLTF